MMKKQTILIVHNYYQIPGGEDTVVANEKRLLEEYGHKVILYSRSNAELNGLSIFQKCILPIVTIFNLRTYREIRKIIKNEKIEIVHVHNTLSLISPSVYYATLSMKIPIIQTIHNFRLLCPGATFYRNGHICEDCISKGLKCSLIHNCYRNSKLQTFVCAINTKFHRIIGIYGKINYICLTKFNKDKLLSLNQSKGKRIFDPNKIYIKANFAYEVQQPTQKQDNEYYLFVGRIEKIKGLDILLEAFSKLPMLKLIIIGGGPLLDDYKDNVPNNIQFIGQLDRYKIANYLYKAKALIVTSQVYETFGMVIVEAYSAHTPVIAGNIENIASLIDDGKTGVRFKYNSASALKSAIERFEHLDTSNWNEYAYKKYINEFSPDSNYRILKKIYDDL